MNNPTTMRIVAIALLVGAVVLVVVGLANDSESKNSTPIYLLAIGLALLGGFVGAQYGRRRS